MIRICMITLCAIMVTMTPSFAQDNGSQWVKMPNAASGLGFNDISAKGHELWALDENNTINRYNFADGAWKAVPTTGLVGKPTEIAASPDGYAVAAAAAADMWPYQFNPEKNAWVKYAVANYQITKVNAISKNSQVWMHGTPETNYRMQHCTTSRENCAVEPAPANANGRCVAIGDENSKWFMSKDKKIYRFNNTVSKYEQIVAPPQCPDCLDVQCPNRVVLTSKCGRVYLWSKDHWYPIPEMENAKVATIDYRKVYVVTYDKKAMAIDTPAEYACGSDCPCSADD